MESRSQGSATKELEKLDTVLTIHISLQLCHAPVQLKPILPTNPVRVLDEASSAVSAAPQEMRTVSPICLFASQPSSLDGLHEVSVDFILLSVLRVKRPT